MSAPFRIYVPRPYAKKPVCSADVQIDDHGNLRGLIKGEAAGGFFNKHGCGTDWFRDESSARLVAARRRSDRIASLEKQLAKLKALPALVETP